MKPWAPESVLCERLNSMVPSGVVIRPPVPIALSVVRTGAAPRTTAGRARAAIATAARRMDERRRSSWVDLGPVEGPARRCDGAIQWEAEDRSRGQFVHVIRRRTGGGGPVCIVKGTVPDSDVPVIGGRVSLSHALKRGGVTRYLGDAFDHQVKRFLLDGDDAAGLTCKVLGLARAATGAEEQPPVHPDGHDGHDMRGSI